MSTTLVHELNPDLRTLYSDIEGRLTVTDGSHRYADLVTPNGNGFLPVHRWFHFKEAFSARLLPQLVMELDLDGSRGLTLLDPFCGVGTSVLSAMHLPDVFQSAYGVEVNPFIRFVAQTKTQSIAVPAREYARAARKVVAIAHTVDAAPVPSLSTFQNREYFPLDTLEALLRLKTAVDSAAVTDSVRALLRLTLAAIIEPSSKLRRDGRALRFEPDKTAADPFSEFARRADGIAADLLPAPRLAYGRVLSGDGRDPRPALPGGSTVDLALFSPPYPNNIDYTEVYKLEAWFLGLITSQEEFRRQRLSTVRSHPSILASDEQPMSGRDVADHLVAPLLEAVPDDRYAVGRRQVVRGYFRDMAATLEGLRSVLGRDGRLVYVVGNSLHGSNGTTLLVAADLLIAALAENLGFQVEQLIVARRPQRRANYKWLRESVVVLRPAESRSA